MSRATRGGIAEHVTVHLVHGCHPGEYFTSWEHYHSDSEEQWMTHDHTPGALVLYDVDRERERLLRVRASTNDEAQRTSDALDALLDIQMERRRVLLSGPNAAHERRARHSAMAFSDGAYIAVHQLDAVFHMRSGARDGSTYDTLRRAHDTAQPSYERLRDYLADDAGVPYLIAVVVAARITDSDKRSPFYGLTTRPIPF